jgi:branched-chain amino acid transport system substrate-binding protein
MGWTRRSARGAARKKFDLPARRENGHSLPSATRGDQGVLAAGFPREHAMKTKFYSGLALAVALGWSFAAQAQVKLGMAGPISGPSAATGAQMKNGVEQAVEDINAGGGILGQKITLSFGDDASDPKQGVSVANKFVGDGIKFVVGDYNSGVSIPASETYQENGIIQITPASTNPTFTERKMWNTFRTCGRDDQQGAVASQYILSKLAGKKIAIVHDKTTYGKGLADETKKGLNAKGVTEVLYEGVNTGEKDYSAVVSKIKQSGADVVFFGGLYTEGGLIVRQMRDQGVTAALMGGDGLAAAEFGSVGGPGVEGSLMTFGPDPTKKPEAAAVVKKLEARKINPESYTLYSYAAVQILKQAIETAKTTDSKKVAEVMHSGKVFDTVIGNISYDAKGDRTDSDYVMYMWKKSADGKLTFEEM